MHQGKMMPRSKPRLNKIGEVNGYLTVIALSENRSGKYQHPRWICLCKCGNFTEVTTGNLRKSRAGVKSCGCLQKEVAMSLTGDSHPGWKGGASSPVQMLKGTVKYRNWREAVFARDDYTCKKCNARGGKLHPHHIMPKADYLDLMFDIDNGVTLCASCHREYHSINGTQNIDPSTFDVYMEAEYAMV